MWSVFYGLGSKEIMLRRGVHVYALFMVCCCVYVKERSNSDFINRSGLKRKLKILRIDNNWFGGQSGAVIASCS